MATSFIVTRRTACWNREPHSARLYLQQMEAPVANLEYVRISADGTQIIVRDNDGHEFALSMDDRLAAALIPRSSPLDGPGALTPREIQSRVRAGADVASLAQQSGTSVERIMAFAVPILQERAHIAVRARATLVRRATGVGTLDDIIVARLHPLGVTLVETHWDARRRDDGRWEILLAYDTAEGGRVASWLYDAKAAVVSPLDDEAHWLLGEPPAAPARVRETSTKPTLPVFHKLEEQVDNVVPLKRRDSPRTEDVADTGAGDTTSTDAVADDGKRPAAPRPAKGRRPIPSWDEILFGAPTEEE